MCSEEEKGFVWSTYLNYQLEALWTIANACGDQTDIKCRYYRSLASFDYPDATGETGTGPRQTPDRITFNKPRLTFICNHAVILSLSVKEGHLSHSNTSNGDNNGSRSGVYA